MPPVLIAATTGPVEHNAQRTFVAVLKHQDHGTVEVFVAHPRRRDHDFSFEGSHRSFPSEDVLRVADKQMPPTVHILLTDRASGHQENVAKS